MLDGTSNRGIEGVAINMQQTLFSTAFFDFQNIEGPIVSKWVWLYWLTTAFLTALTNIVWYWSIRRKEKEIDQRHDDAQKMGDVVEKIEPIIKEASKD